MKLGVAIEQVAEVERRLAHWLTAVGERHPDEQDIFHLTKTLANMERGHIDALAPHATRYGAQVGQDDADPDESAVLEPPDGDGLRMPLLSDLRGLHLVAAGVSLDWVALAQGAQAAKDTDLLATVTECHEETLKTLKWTTYRLKEAAPQALTS